MFAMTFVIVLFIVLMQFLWKYMDDLIGKGLEVSVLAELFFYAALSMVPMALPLAILLASLMTFGNLGEKSELTAIKASGVSLLKTMSPLIVVVTLISIGAFFFQNDVLPRTQVKMWTLLFSARQKSPELEIPEGSFYGQIPGYNIFVKEKNRENGLLYNVMIYDVSHGDNSTILLADTARLAFTPDMKYLYLHLKQGEQFENLRESGMDASNIPFRREKFLEKEILLPFDANFNRLDEEGMRNQYVGKNITELRTAIDSLTLLVDSIGLRTAEDFPRRAFPNLAPSVGSPTEGMLNASDTRPVKPAQKVKEEKTVPPNFDSLLLALTSSQREQVFNMADNYRQMRRDEMEFRAVQIHDEKVRIRRHSIELIKKYTLSVACLVFLFIGAPLGAIIRKGGLGAPMVISVLLFVVYYIFDNTGFKMAREGIAPPWLGIWLSTFVLLPLGIFVTWKAMNDSSVFNPDLYKEWLRRRLGIPTSRQVVKKEVIINDIDVEYALSEVERLKHIADAWLHRYGHIRGYRSYWLAPVRRQPVERMGMLTDEIVNYLSDSQDLHLIALLNKYPVLTWLWVYAPFRSYRVRKIFYWVFPLGFSVYLLSIPYNRRLRNDVERISSSSLLIQKRLMPEIDENPVSEQE